jgi:Fructose-2,6-bisphosphatase
MRAKQTAEAIARATNKQIEFSDLFVERRKPSSVYGKPHTDEQASRTWHEWNESFFAKGKVEDGESYNEIVKRVDDALDYLLNRPEKTLLVVTHGYFLRAIVARVLLGNLLSPESLKRFQRLKAMENTGITAIVYEPAFAEGSCWRVWIYNDHAHLAE